MTRVMMMAAGLLLPLAAQAGDAAAGKTAFATYCATCHGETGKGDGPAAVALDPKPANFGDASFWEGKDEAHILKVITEGGAAVGKSPIMVAWKGALNDTQIADVTTYVMSLKP